MRSPLPDMMWVFTCFPPAQRNDPSSIHHQIIREENEKTSFRTKNPANFTEDLFRPLEMLDYLQHDRTPNTAGPNRQRFEIRPENWKTRIPANDNICRIKIKAANGRFPGMGGKDFFQGKPLSTAEIKNFLPNDPRHDQPISNIPIPTPKSGLEILSTLIGSVFLIQIRMDRTHESSPVSHSKSPDISQKSQGLWYDGRLSYIMRPSIAIRS